MNTKAVHHPEPTGPTDPAADMGVRRDTFAEALATAMTEREFTYASLAQALKKRGASVSAPTLRTWSRGEGAPARGSTRRAVATIEEVLQLRPGSLSTLLDVESSELAEHSCHDHFPTLCRVMADSRRACTVTPMPGHRPLMLLSELDLRDPAAPTVTLRLTFTSSLADMNCVHVAVDSADLSREPIRIDGAQVGEWWPVPGTSLTVVELLLPRLLAIDDAWAIEAVLPAAEGAGQPGDDGRRRFHTVATRPFNACVASVLLPEATRTVPEPEYVAGWRRRRAGQTTPDSSTTVAPVAASIQSVAVDGEDGDVWVRW